MLKLGIFLSAFLVQSLMIPQAEVLQPAIRPEHWLFPTATMLQKTPTAEAKAQLFPASSVLPSVLFKPQYDYLRLFLTGFRRLVSASHAPIPDQAHIARQRLLHATIALDCFTTTLTDPRGFRPRTKRWLSDALPSQPLSWDRVWHWLYVAASCLAVFIAITDLSMSSFLRACSAPESGT